MQIKKKDWEVSGCQDGLHTMTKNVTNVTVLQTYVITSLNGKGEKVLT